MGRGNGNSNGNKPADPTKTKPADSEGAAANSGDAAASAGGADTGAAAGDTSGNTEGTGGAGVKAEGGDLGDPAPVQTQPAPEPPAQAPAAPARRTEPKEEPATATLLPCDNGAVEASPAMKELLLDACERFNVDPTLERVPRELLKWRYEPANRLTRVPAAVVIVTSGGVKLKHYEDPDYPMDQDTEETLARIFGAFAKDADKNVVRTPLPEDLALPIQAVTGIPQTADHVFRRGYLREGGKKEADKRDKAQRQKAKQQ